MKIEINVTDTKETIKLLDRANSLIDELRKTVLSIESAYAGSGIVLNQTDQANGRSSSDTYPKASE